MFRKLFYLILSIVIFNFIPTNSILALSQDQINAEVQVLCPDTSDNWFSGSGTIISDKGIIITNKHVVTGADGNIIKYCYIGTTNQLDTYADFSNNIIAETKYYNTSSDPDVAMLYVVSNNNNFNYFNIFNSTASKLYSGNTIDVIGYPGYNDLKLTQTNGNFVQFGKNNFSNYFQATSYINHGNSGGAAYNNDNFVGIPTFGISTPVGTEYYFLTIDSVKNWLNSTLGSNYMEKILGYTPEQYTPDRPIQADHTPPVIKNAPRDVFWYKAYNNANEKVKGIYTGDNFPWKDLYTTNQYNKIQITMRKNQYQWSMNDMDSGSGLQSVIYAYSNDIHEVLNTAGFEKNISLGSTADDNQIIDLTPIITLPNITGTYYVSIRFKDNVGNISEPYILTYVYENDAFLKLQNVKFYSDPNYQNMIGNYDFTLSSWDGYHYPQYHQYCVTNKKNLYVKWEYDKNYSEYAVASYHEDITEMSAAESLLKGGTQITSINKYQINNLDTSHHDNNWNGYSICDGYSDESCVLTGKVTSLLLKPNISNNNPTFEGWNTVIKFAYNPNYSYGIRCGEYNIPRGRNQYGHLYFVLKDSKPLIEDSAAFDTVQQQIYDSLNEDTNTLFNPQPKEVVTEEPPEQISGVDIDLNLANRLKGIILLQVEAHGEAFYVYPKDGRRYYMANGSEAYRIMRYLGVGITNADLDRVLTNKTFAKQHSGKIFLQVEAHGEAFYIDFDGNAYYLKDGSAAYNIMRDLGLGITNSDLSKIPLAHL